MKTREQLRLELDVVGERLDVNSKEFNVKYDELTDLKKSRNVYYELFAEYSEDIDKALKLKRSEFDRLCGEQKNIHKEWDTLIDAIFNKAA